MNSNENKKISCFIIIAFILSLFSFFVRTVLVNNFNNTDMILFKVDFIKNYGAAFSLFHTHTSFLICVSVLILVATLYYIFRSIKDFSNFDLFFSAMLCAGIICNLIERIVDGYVTDYIRLTFVAFPIFNTSDIYISIGAFILICNILFNNERKKD